MLDKSRRMLIYKNGTSIKSVEVIVNPEYFDYVGNNSLLNYFLVKLQNNHIIILIV